MIKINLAPQETGGGRAASASVAPGNGIVILVAIIALLINGGAAGYVGYNYTSLQNKQGEVKAEENRLKTEYERVKREHAEIQQMLDTLTRQVALLEALDPEDRLLWARKLNLLPLIVPDGVYLTQIEVTENETERETQESINARRAATQAGQTPPPRQMVRVLRQRLAMNGVAYVEGGSSDDRLNQYIAFLQNLRDGRYNLPFDDQPVNFMDGFDPRRFNPGNFEQGNIGGREVSRFSLSLESLPVTLED